jgi:taurine dioxygenase
MTRQQALSASAARITPLGSALGVRVTGVDLKRLDDAAWRAIEQAFHEHHLMAVPGQTLTPEELMAFSRRLGPLEAHVLTQYHHLQHPEILMLSNVVQDGKALGLADAGTYWHSDISYKAKPSAATVLYGVEIPDQGGDTLFANTMAAYEDLPEAMKRRLDGLQAEHNYAYRHSQLVRDAGIRAPLTEEQIRQTPSVTHPVVRTHPVTGRKALYVNPGFTVRILGLSDAGSEALKQELFDHCLKPKYRLAYRWQAGDVVAWDNAAVIHSATTRDLPREKRRTLLRTIVSGDVPF